MPPRKTATAQDKPFTFKSKSGHVVKIPAKVTFDPDVIALTEFNRAERAGDEQGQAVAFMEMLLSGFPPEVAQGIKIKASEVGEFSRAYFEHTGMDIPKS